MGVCTCKDEYDFAIRKLAEGHFHKMLHIDITADTFEVLTVGDYEWDKKTEEQPSQKISEWFTWFADGPLCHENDRQRFKDFTNLNSLKAAFEQADYETISIVYRRKFDVSEPTFSTVSMELYPVKEENGHLTAFLFVRNITAEIAKYNSSLEENAQIQNFVTGKRTILIVEDNEMNRDILEEILVEGGYDVIQAENGAVGLELLQKHMMEISIVILDVQMPVMNGYEFLKYSQSDPFLSNIPVVVATGSDSSDEEKRCLGLGAADFVSKPYKPDIILSRIANIIHLKESVATMSMLQMDDTTGLYNVRAFHHMVKKEMDKAPEKAYSVTVFDVAHYKYITERYGDEAGKEILKQLAEVLKDYLAASNINGRYGAARFFIFREMKSEEEPNAWIQNLLNSLTQVCDVKGISFKAGVYENIDTGLPASKICDRAITALNNVNQNFENQYALYDSKQAEKEQRLLVMEEGMQDAYDQDQFAVYYQPKHDVYTGKLVGAEALIRWIHPEYGFLSPGEFIPLFEKNGFISYADYYVLKRTCRNLKLWADEGIATVPVSVNSSRRDFDRDDYVDLIMKPLKENGIDPSLIHVEVTESLFSDRIEEIGQVLQELRSEGLKIELDDFGSGYSSLTTLASLPLDVMKLDMSFMKDYMNPRKRKILSMCIRLAQSLGLKTVSEGVELEEQRSLLQEYGCDYIQGYYFSKPLPENEFREYLLKCQGK